MLRPNAQITALSELTPEWLRARGLKGVVLDLDNTLVPYGEEGPVPEALLEWLASLKAAGIKVAIVTNALPGRARHWGERLGLEVRALAGKPWKGFRRTIRRMGLTPREVAVVGDQLFTDVLGGNLVGAYTVLVPPLSEKGLPHTRLIRRLERCILRTTARP
ncbi:YqeG family HAD IIIA-type phosphatase [Marinithermus hydrothermalis]|uniref:HAD superfamily (Subfamily IIIA) phosphatase, TIGR01668 n=1 Tax=Marinithermus hydrothermalis (strain DSM 14884 / JCM 11576 / T1) TaxID=869210 RepID=F2NPR2_MARHT|nr:YqeG family HAD IIIA-type phosphatase [Marinithermus hydrothermalis]AEB12838.1 HAD superfamily (subfamily IIIA) phosphatase, TIGR01668 [Marinithermus hydrothermalis DSM 14884]